MIYLMMLPAFIVMAIAMYYTCRLGEKPNGHILLGVTLPYEQMKHPQVLAIVKSYHKVNLHLLYLALAVLIPTYFIRDYISMILLYLTIYCTWLIFISHKNYVKYFRKLYELKKENDWFPGKTHVIRIDTEVSRLKNTFPVSWLWFLPSFLFCSIPFFLGRIQGILWIIPISCLLIVLLCFILYKVVSRDKTIIYSDDTDVNVALNRVYKREWSKYWVIASYGVGILNIAQFSLQWHERYYMIYFFALITLSIVCTVLPLFFTYSKIRSTRNRLLIMNTTTIQTDEDEFWIKGYYYNPDDPRTLVEKRIGIGMTTNMATSMGKASNFLLAATVLFMVGLSLVFIPFDFGEIEMEIVEGNTVQITAPQYSETFELDDIVSVEMMTSFPGASKTHGIDSSKFYIGDFYVDGYHECKVYIYRKTEECLLVELTNGYVFLNGVTKEKTEAFYDALTT